ncbi:MAG: Na/Pi symporter, partial [Gammaproteobacteria bacterium]|nr:Na/Pi symporter [Gammaproteobacteria bacterium]
ISILGFKVKMSAMALPLVGLGFLLSLSRNESKRHWGLFTIGFAVLFIGLEFLKDSVPDISSNPEILAFLADYTSHGYLSILFFLALGAVLTLVIQSSSATMALTLLMCFEGWLPYDMAAAMVIGQNIGTTITALIAAYVANYYAKRAAWAHLIFNLFGVVWILILFYPFIEIMAYMVEYLEGMSPFASAAAIPIALSLFHTSFNIINALLLVGFISGIVKTVERLVPAVPEKVVKIDEPKFLDETSIQFSQTGIKALSDESIRLLQNAAYKVLAHGLSIHREELERTEDFADIVNPSKAIKINIDEIYSTKIKTIYSRILEYATRLQRQCNLTQEEIETVRNILVADRLLVQVVKRMKPLHENLARYMESENESIRREYNILRRRILKVVRDIRRICDSDDLKEQLENIKRHRASASNMDVLLSGRLDELLIEGGITHEMATSLMNDSSNAARITKNLVDIATILYAPRDQLIEVIDQQNAEQDVSPGSAATAPAEEAVITLLDETAE